jgi:hypothetical protein
MEEEMLAVTKNAAIPLALLEELRDYARNAFEEAAGVEMRVGIFLVMIGSSTRVSVITCACSNKTKEKVCYWDPILRKNVCCCRNNACRP